MRDVVHWLNEALRGGREFVYCQVVETKGSTPQKAGAGMVVEADGGQTGTLGGGCVEAEVKQRAIGRIDRDGAELQTFVLDHDHAWADGLICGGKMSILAEAPRGPASAAYFQALERLLDAGDGFQEGVVIDAARGGLAVPLGTRVLVGPDGGLVANLPADLEVAEIVASAADLASRPKPGVRGGVAWLPTLPRIRLVIVGAGHVGQAVARMASEADFDVWIVDDRRQYANTERFPEARRVLVGPIGAVLADLDVDPRTYALIVTRGHGHDEEALGRLAPTRASYVGLIGSRRKIRLIFESLVAGGLDPSTLERVAAPVGLEIGSQSVPEIAVSIVAELIARRNLGEPALARLRGASHAERGESKDAVVETGVEF